MITTIPPGTVPLVATVDPDLGWVPLDYLWTVVEGTGVVIADPTARSTTATFPAAGRYVLQFSASAPAQGTFLKTIDNRVLTTEDGQPFAVEGHGSPGFSPGVSATRVLQVRVFPAATPPLERPEPVGWDLHVLIDGVEYAVGRLDDTKGVLLTAIHETSDAAPNTAALTARGFFPTEGQSIVIRLDDVRIFAGRIIRDGAAFDELWENRNDSVSAVDWTWDLTRRRITATFTDVAPATVVAAIVARAPGFTVDSVTAGGLVSVAFDNTPLPDALQQVCDQIPRCTWTVDYFKAIRVGPAELLTPQPTPLTYAHPTIAHCTIPRELGAWVTRLRVYGASVSSRADVPLGQSAVPVGDGGPFGDGGGHVLLTGLAPSSPRPGDPIVPDRLETSFGGVVRRTTSAQGPTRVIPTEADASCLEPIEQARHTDVQVRARAIRVPVSEDHPGLEPGLHGYYLTYVNADGETDWQRFLTVMVGSTGLLTVPPAPSGALSLPPEPLHYNAVEFVADAIPPTIQRINVYRDDPRRLVGALTAKGTFGPLGTHTGYEFRDTFTGYKHPTDLGLVVGPSSQTLVDAFTVAELGAPYALPLPEVPSPTPHCPSPAPPPADPSDPVALPAAAPLVDTFLVGVSVGVPIPSGATFTRFLDVVDTAVEAQLALLLDDDGVVEGEAVRGSYTDDGAMATAGFAALTAQNQARVGVEFEAFDRDLQPGTIVSAYLPPHLSGEFVIKTVAITGFEPVGCANGMKSYPRYHASAEPRYATVVNLLRR